MNVNTAIYEVELLERIQNRVSKKIDNLQGCKDGVAKEKIEDLLSVYNRIEMKLDKLDDIIAGF